MLKEIELPETKTINRWKYLTRNYSLKQFEWTEKYHPEAVLPIREVSHCLEREVELKIDPDDPFIHTEGDTGGIYIFPQDERAEVTIFANDTDSQRQAKPETFQLDIAALKGIQVVWTNPHDQITIKAINNPSCAIRAPMPLL